LGDILGKKLRPNHLGNILKKKLRPMTKNANWRNFAQSGHTGRKEANVG
jgi:hypothetical protein